MDLVTTVLGPIIEKTGGAIGHRIGYVYHYTKNLQDLQQKVDGLKGVRSGIEKKIKAAKEWGDTILDSPSNWITNANDAVEGAEKLLAEREHNRGGRCLNGLCPKIYSRHRLSRDAKKKVAVLVELIAGASDLEPISEPAPLPSFESRFGCSDFEDFESRKQAFEEIMNAFQDAYIHVIGIYGMGGVGKTTTTVEAGVRAEKSQIFDRVVNVTVSHNLNIGKVQDEIAAQLDLKLDDQPTEVGKAGRLLQRLMNAKKILIILDDVWEELNLKEIGIPSANGVNGCKILLTTRRESVCEKMRVNKKIPIGILCDNEAWILFRRQVEDNIPRGMHEVAKQVCKECAGLPISILAIGRTLIDKSSFEWADVLEQLRNSRLNNIDGVAEKVYAPLLVSYNNLRLEDAKPCFLFCCLFPEDFDIPIESILRYGRGVGVPGVMGTLHVKRNRVRYLVNYLERNCMLLKGRDEEHVKMHDVFRDVAISIASEGQHMFLSEAGGDIKEWPKRETYDGYTAAFYRSSSPELPDGLECPKLNTLILSLSSQNMRIPQTFFAGMVNLKVLVLKEVGIPELRPSIGSLVDLRVLCLEGCVLGELSLIRKLKKLEMLILRNSKFDSLPTEIEGLSDLRLLDLRHCYHLESISLDVISHLSGLEELFFPLNLRRWSSRAVNNQQKRVNWGQLKSLSRLEALEMAVPTEFEMLPQELGFSFWANLTNFRISINAVFLYPGRQWLKNTLILKGVSLTGWEAGLLKRVEILCIEELNASENLRVYKDDPESFSKLVRLDASSCHGMSEILSMAAERSTPHLTELNIVDCNLEHLFSPSMVKGLVQLQSLRIERCKSLKSVVGRGEEKNIKDPVLFFGLEDLVLRGLPVCVSFYPESDEGLLVGLSQAGACQPFFSQEIGFPNLRALTLEGMENVEEIWMDGIRPPPSDSFCNLTHLYIQKCRKLERVIPPAILPILHHLERLEVRVCQSVREVIEVAGVASEVVVREEEQGHGGAAASARDFSVLPNLRYILLSGLPNLETAWKVEERWMDRIQPPPPPSFCNLTELNIFGCPKLERAIPPSILPSLQHLEVLLVWECESMREVIDVAGVRSAEVEEENGHGASSVLPKLANISLKNLPNLENLPWEAAGGVSVSSPHPSFLAFPSLYRIDFAKCGPLRSLFSSPSTVPHNLGCLEIRDCKEMEEIVSCQEEVDAAASSIQIIFPHLQTLKLKDLPSLATLFHESSLKEETYIEGRDYLDIEIVRCGCLRYLFPSPSTALAFGQNLRCLDIGDCEKLEEIVNGWGSMGKDVVDASASSNPIIFPRLWSLRLQNLPSLTTLFYESSLKEERYIEGDGILSIHIAGCGRLRYLFSSPSAALAITPLNLVWLKVIDCEKMEEIVSCRGSMEKEVDVAATNFSSSAAANFSSSAAASNQIIFPHLKRLELKNLPNLSSLCPWGYLLFQPESSLVYECIDCPNLSADLLYGLCLDLLFQESSSV